MLCDAIEAWVAKRGIERYHRTAPHFVSGYEQGTKPVHAQAALGGPEIGS